MFRLAAVAFLAMAAALPYPRKKKTEEELTQQLELPKEPPAFLTVEPKRFVCQVSPLSSKGLLSQQVRDAVKSLLKSNSGSAIVKLRAFVAGSGDLRRVPMIVSEIFTEKKLPLPVVSVIQVGGLGVEGAQVLIESTALAKKAVNPHGVVLVSGQGASGQQAIEPVLPLARTSVENLKKVLAGAGSGPAQTLRVTCFLSSLDGLDAVRSLVAGEFPKAPLSFVQTSRAPARAVAECEAVAALSQPAGEPVKLVNPPGLAASPNFSQAAVIGADRVVLTTTQISFGYQDADARLAFQRLQKLLDQAGASIRSVAFSGVYPLSTSLAEQVRRIRFEFYDRSRPPASTLLPFEGLPGMEAGFAVEVVALPR
jgi:enamine deaminase RidA (YjgF/YER057c/UK114 family)